MPPMNPGPRTAPRIAAGYRTVCVRSCDGAFFPISYSTSEGQFGRDQTTCSNACPGARLYYYKASNQDPDDMVDMSGHAYSKSPNANLFRTQYVEACKCKPHPWEQQAADQHRIYALEAQRRKGNRAVVAELDNLKAKTREKVSPNSRGRNERSGRNQTTPLTEATRANRPAAGNVAMAQMNTAPRSDATRGQNTDRLQAQAQTAAETIGPEIQETSTARLSPSNSPIGAAATAAAMPPPSGSIARGPRPSADAPTVTPANLRSGRPGQPGELGVNENALGELGMNSSSVPGLQPEAMPAPEAIIALPFEQLPGASQTMVESPQSTGRNSPRRSRAAERERRTAEQSPQWQTSRTTDWTRRAFGQ